MPEVDERPISVEGEADLTSEQMDTLLAGGEPNEERIPFEQPSTDPDVDQNTLNQELVKKEEQSQKIVPGVDPIVSQLQQALSKLTPEQRSQLMPAAPVELTRNGEKIAVPPEKQQALMQMGLDYSEKMRALNTERQNFDQAKQQISDMERYYGEIDRVAKANPQWWQHVQAEYQKFSAGAGTGQANQSDAEMTPALRAALSKVDTLEKELRGYLDKQTQEATMKQQQAEDAELEQQINSFAKEHSEYDWLTADANGLVLADRIVMHAHKNGINNFRAAFRDYMHDDIVSRRELKVKEDLKSKIQADTRSGKVTKSGKPNGLRAPSNLNKSYEDLMNEGFAELG